MISHQEHPRAGFTIVELLVVIAIVSMLIALLLPALAQARARSQQVACMSQLRQQGIAMAGYVSDDRQGAWPMTARHRPHWMIRLAPYLVPSPGVYDNAINTSKAPDKLIPGLLCPTHRDKPRTAYYLGGTYGINLVLTNGRPDNASAAADNKARRTFNTLVTSPSTVVIVFDVRELTPIDNWSPPTTAVQGSGSNNRRDHLGKLNFLIGDGHVEHLGPGSGRADVMMRDKSQHASNWN